MGTSIKTCILVFTGMALLAFIGCGGGATGSPSTPAVHNEWTWMGGSNTIDQPGTYGTQGTTSAHNTPGARVWGCSWTDQAGNFWLFGGFGATPHNGQGDFNDLWQYTNGEWTWMGGSNQAEQPGAYGTMGTAAPSNIPGARWEATCWTDPQGNFWLYGGLGIDSQGTRGLLGDLWRYSKGEWTWMSGSNIAWSAAWSGVAVFGTQGVASPSNTPGRDSGRQRGLIHRETSGFSAGWVLSRMGAETSTIFGNTATASGPGWLDRTRLINTGRTGPSECQRPETLQARGSGPLPGSMPKETCGSSEERAWERAETIVAGRWTAC